MITLLIILINILVFFVMISLGVDFFNPAAQSIHYFGGTYGPDILHKGEYWRLLTSNYIHIGFIHLLFNMWCLYSIGSELEELIGSNYFMLIYSISGIIGSISSCFINYNIVGAGASGAIFGISGSLLIIGYFVNKNLRYHGLRYDYAPLMIFIIYNTIYGFSVSGIDNSAHIGGLLSGIILGYLVLNIRKHQKP